MPAGKIRKEDTRIRVFFILLQDFKKGSQMGNLKWVNYQSCDLTEIKNSVAKGYAWSLYNYDQQTGVPEKKPCFLLLLI